MTDSERKTDCWKPIKITKTAMAEDELLASVAECRYRVLSELRPNQAYYCTRCNTGYQHCPNLPDEIRDGRSLATVPTFDKEVLTDLWD